MSDPRHDLSALVADLKATLAGYVGRGLTSEPVDAPPPEAEWVDGLEEHVDEPEPHPDDPGPDGPTPTPGREHAPAPAPRPVASGVWDRVATRARAERVPDHFDDGVADEGLRAIRAELGDCTRCGLCEGRKHLVFGVGDPDADLMVVGEGPGEQEDLRGEPFVGPAGQMLDNMLERVIGLKRSQVYIANVVKCRPPGNRNPTPEETATCKPYLYRQIAAVQPRVLLVLGGVALEQVLDVKGIMRHRGQERAFRGIPAIPTFHPAYLLRKPVDKRLTMQDLLLVKRRYDELGGRR